MPTFHTDRRVGIDVCTRLIRNDNITRKTTQVIKRDPRHVPAAPTAHTDGERERDRTSATPSLLITVITKMLGFESLVPCAFN